MRTDEFWYDLPEHLISQRPADPRDSARLLDCRDLSDHVFRDLPNILNPSDLLVVNRTRVRAARLFGQKIPSGGRIELLLLKRLGHSEWEALVKPARRVKRGQLMTFGPISGEAISEPEEGRIHLKLESAGDIEEAIATVGHTPLPPYITTQLADPEQYQTVYSDQLGSAAAPTAGLHFTDHTLDRLVDRGIGTVTVDLDVGLDTFRPISTERITDHQMHSEDFRISQATADAVNEARGQGRRVVAVGTTVVRSLEAGANGAGELQKCDSSTNLFISPGYRFKIVDALVTNFHIPSSSLVVLIASILGERWRGVYETAIEREYRFLSFGDAMFCEVQE